MTSKVKLKEAFEPVAKFGAFYSGGHVEWHDKHLYCQNPTHVSKVSVETGIVALEIGKESEAIEDDTILTFVTNGDCCITAHKSGLFKLWNATSQLEKQWKCIHKGPVASLHLNGDHLFSGGSDAIVRGWDMTNHACVMALKGAVGVINVLTHCGEQIFASGDDGKVIAWENGAVKQIYSGHFSKVTSIKFSHDAEHFVSAGRDKVIILWKLNDGHALRTVPVYQSIEGLVILPAESALIPAGRVCNGGVIVACAGEKGSVSIWDVSTSKELYKQENSLISAATVEGSLAVTHLLVDSIDANCEMLAMVSAEHNIIIHCRQFFTVLKQFVGFSDEILDVTFCGEQDEYLAVATNSSDIKLYHSTSMSCQLLKGHTDIVMAVNVAPFNARLLASSAKDNTTRLWYVDSASRCVALGLRHTATVSAVCFFNSAPVLFTGSQDNCVKLWDLSPLKNLAAAEEVRTLHATSTEVAHAKDINSVAVSPNDKLLASCSQDKTIKLWTDSLTLLGVLKGHKRSVWCCRFSPVDQVLATASADCTIKLWSITELACLKTLAGHDASVLRVEFLSQGVQLLSCGADGLVKLFDVKTSECAVTLEEHDGRIWALSIARDEATFVTAGSDSLLVKWQDVTEARRLQKLQLQEEAALEEQRLANYLHQDQLLKALKLSLKLSKPFTALNIVMGVIRRDEDLTETMGGLENHEKETLMKFASDWNTNSRNCQAAQLVLNILLREVQAGAFRPAHLTSIIEGNLGYTQRHFKRMTQLQQDLRFIDYTIKCMQPFDASS